MAAVFLALASFLPRPLGLPLHNSGASFSAQDEEDKHSFSTQEHRFKPQLYCSLWDFTDKLLNLFEPLFPHP